MKNFDLLVTLIISEDECFNKLKADFPDMSDVLDLAKSNILDNSYVETYKTTVLIPIGNRLNKDAKQLEKYININIANLIKKTNPITQ